MRKKERCENHNWAQLIAKTEDGGSVPTSAKICLRCGLLQSLDLKVGTNTITISRDYLDMDSRPIRNVSGMETQDYMVLPVGTDKYYDDE